MQFLPRSEDVSGWTLLDDPEVYPAAQLDDWIGAEANDHRAYRIVDLTIGRYQSSDGKHATVELFRFPDFVQAFGAWSARSFPGAEPIEIPNRAVSAPWSMHAWRGPFYVRVIGGIDGEPAGETPAPNGGSPSLNDRDEAPESGGERADAPTLRSLLAATLTDIPEAPGLPAVMRFLPPRDRIAGSERYLAGPGLGHPFLANSFLIDFEKEPIIVDEQGRARVDPEGEPQRVTGLILPSPSREVATRIFNAFQSFYERNGRVLDPIPNLGEQNLTAEDEYTGRTVAFRIDRFVVIFTGFADLEVLRRMAIESDQRIIDAIRQALTEAERRQRERERRQRQQ